MRQLTHPTITAFGIAVLGCAPLIGPLISPNHLWVYHQSEPTASIFLAVLLDVLLLWALLTGVFLLARRHGRVRVVVWSAMVLMLPSLVLIEGVVLRAWSVPLWLEAGLFFVSLLCWITLIALWRQSFLPVFERVERVATILLAYAAISGVASVAQMIWCFARAGDSNTPIALHQDANSGLARGDRPKIIWIILDELSYQQLYERRFPGLALPAFDRLARQSTVFTHVVPAGLFTEKVLPSLISGAAVDKIRSSPGGRMLMVHHPAGDQWLLFDEHQTVFQDALDRGYSTAVAGWYIPYCRILPQVLDHCFWSSHTVPLARRMETDATVLQNAAAPWRNIADLLYAISHRQSGQAVANTDASRHLEDYRELSFTGDRFLEDPSINFLLLHMPIPHPPGIYGREKKDCATCGSSYIDNLALADRYLDHIYVQLERSGAWDSATVVVMGDHSWRAHLQRNGTAQWWTAEDEAASHGGEFDDRPAYIVKLPRQTKGFRIETPFPALRTRELLRKMMSGEVRSPEDLAVFAR